MTGLSGSYSNIFTLITRMRQMADHPDLVLKGRSAKAINASLEASGLDQLNLSVCRICLDEAEDAIQSSCRHM